MKKLYFLIILAIISALAVRLIFGERFFVLFFDGKGSIESGSKFGISIGEQCAVADKKMISAKYKRTSGDCQSSEGASTQLNYLDRSTRPGLVSIKLGRGGVVSAIKWNYVD
jgi:hypothetical protein